MSYCRERDMERMKFVNYSAHELSDEETRDGPVEILRKRLEGPLSSALDFDLVISFNGCSPTYHGW